MNVIGITGGIGTGKSTLLKILSEKGIPTLSADQVVKDLFKTNSEVQEEIHRLFPQACSFEKIHMDRLSKIIDHSPQSLTLLENLLHPLVIKQFHLFKEESLTKKQRCIALEIPLLFETYCEEWLDVVIVLTSPLFLRFVRVLKRPKMTLKRFLFFKRRQLSLKEYLKRADYVIYNGGNKDFLISQINAILKKIHC